MSLTPVAPFCSFAGFENAGVLKISECGNRLICFGLNYPNLSDAFDADGMVRCRTGGIALSLFFYGQHGRFDEERRTLRVVARRQNFNGGPFRHPVGRDRPGRKWQRRSRSGAMERNTDWAPTAGAPVHPVLEFLHTARGALLNGNSWIRPDELDVGVQKLGANRGGALSIVTIHIRRNF